MTSSVNDRIPVRRPKVDFNTDIPKYWANGDPVLSAFMASLSTIFPDGERFFIFALRNYIEQIEEEELKQAMRGFIGQEAAHGRLHSAYNEWLAEKGYPVAGPLAKTRQAMLWMRKAPPLFQLAFSAAFEHFTALFGEFVTDQDPEVLAELATWHNTMYQVWVWHGIEENEHKSVAFDALQHVNNSYLLRASTMVLVSLFTVAVLGWLTSYYLITDGKFTAPVLYKGIKRMWYKPGMVSRTVVPWLAYFKPGFHPWQRDNRNNLEIMTRKLEAMGLFEKQTSVSAMQSTAAAPAANHSPLTTS